MMEQEDSRAGTGMPMGGGSSAGTGGNEGPQPPTSAPPSHLLKLRFVGSGSEYFRIWIVNLLLTLLTLGLYYPYAKLRRLRYFFSATEVGGQPLSFHARGRNMYLGYALVAALAGSYTLAGQVSPLAGAAAFGIVLLLWPALWHAALRFRMFNTGWRGLRFAFVGSRGGAYVALWPVFALVLVGLLAGVLAAIVMPDLVPEQMPGQMFGQTSGQTAPVDADVPADEPAGLTVAMFLPLLPLLLLLLLSPLLLWLMRRYQHDHYQLATERTRFTVPLRAFYGLALRTLGLSIVVGMVVLAGVALLMYGGWTTTRDVDTPEARLEMLGRGLLAGAFALFALQLLLRPYVVSRLQNLVWNGTLSQHLRFDSTLRLRPLMWLTLKNWLLMIVTLGLYFPFATVATARLRLEAVQVVSTLHPDAFAAQGGPVQETAAGDAAGDLFGVDIGL